MSTTKKTVAAVVVVLVLTGFVYYGYAVRVWRANLAESPVPAGNKQTPSATKPEDDSLAAGVRTVNARVEYWVPGDTFDDVRFTLALDQDGAIVGVKTEDALKNAVSTHQAEFSQELLTVVRGKKLSELTALDRVGKSSLTTNAFNSVIDDLQAQL